MAILGQWKIKWKLLFRIYGYRFPEIRCAFLGLIFGGFYTGAPFLWKLPCCNMRPAEVWGEYSRSRHFLGMPKVAIPCTNTPGPLKDPTMEPPQYDPTTTRGNLRDHREVPFVGSSGGLGHGRPLEYPTGLITNPHTSLHAPISPPYTPFEGTLVLPSSPHANGGF